MPTSPPRPCRKCGQRVHRAGLCQHHYRQSEQMRGSSGERGYDASHARRFRSAVLDAAGWVCVRCGGAASVADHYPRTRKQLVQAGDDPNDPQYGRALCKLCHDRHTASTSIARPGR